MLKNSNKISDFYDAFLLIKKYSHILNETSQHVYIEQSLNHIKCNINHYKKSNSINQITKDIQKGLNILNLYSKSCNENQILEDGIFGKITKYSLNKALDNFNSTIVTKYILTGAINNAISAWQKNKNTNIEQQIQVILNSFGD